MRLSRLSITNYQSIAHADIELGDWTSLTGSSDTGKSSILRAFYALLVNQRGDHFIRHGEQSCAVTVTRSDGLEVEWRKGRGKSGAYRVGETVYDRTAGEVPDAVRAALPIFVDIDGEMVAPGFQRQFDRPFLFADTPRHRAQILGQFDGTNILLLAETRLRREQRAAQGIVSVQSERHTVLVAELEALGFVAELGVALEVAQAAQETRQRLQERYVGIAATVDLLGRAAAAEASLRAPGEAAGAHLTQAGDWLWSAKLLRFKLDGMSALIEPLTVSLPELPELPDLSPWREANERRVRGDAILQGWAATALSILASEFEMAGVTEQLAEFRTCPTCGRLWEEEIHAAVV